MSNEWQPIETAPKDGTSVLLYCGVWVEIETGWYGTLAEYNNETDDLEYEDCWQNSYEKLIPSHWMPLPQPPENK